MTATKLDFIVMAGCGMAVVVGQATLEQMGDIPFDLGNAGALGVLAFYMWWNTTKTIPGIIREHREDMRLQEAVYEKRLEAQCAAFRQAMQRDEEEHTRQIEMLMGNARAKT